MDNSIITILKYENHSAFNDLISACSSVQSSLDRLLNYYKQNASIAMNDNRFDLVSQYNQHCQELVNMQKELSQWLIQIANYEDREDQLVLVDEPDYAERIDCTQYEVDCSQPHTMDEDFTNTKICGFDFNGQTYIADSWQDALVKLDAELYRLDSKKLLSFVNDLKYKGNRIQYFVKTPVERKTKPIPGTDIYAWINLSANQIVRLMRKLLKSYNMDEITIYLRADYSELHK